MSPKCAGIGQSSKTWRRSTARGFALCAAVALIGCGETPRPNPVAVSPPMPEATPRGAGEVDAALAKVPAEAVLVGVLDVDALLTRWLPMALGIEAGSEDARSLRADIDAFVRKHVGVDVASAKRAIFYVGDGKNAAVLLLGATGAPAGAEKAGEHEGIAIVGLGEEMFAAGLDGGLAIGSRSGVEQMIDVAKGRSPAASSAAATLSKALGAVGHVELAIAVNAAPLGALLESAKLPLAAAAGMGVGSGDVSGVRVVAVGTREQIGAIEALLNDKRKQAEALIAGLRKSEADSGGAGGELGLLVADFALRGVVRNLVVKNEGEVLTLSIPFRALLPAGGTVASAIAIPPTIAERRKDSDAPAKAAPRKEDGR